MTGAAINAHIRAEFARLAKEPFEHETGRLPLRTDVFYWGASHLAGEHQPTLDASGLDRPEVTRQDDGTAEITFRRGPTYLSLAVLCKGVVNWALYDHDTYVDGFLPDSLAEEAARLARLVARLREGGGHAEAG